MSALIGIEHIVVHRLETHFKTGNSSAAPHTTVLIGHIFRPGLNGQSDDTMSGSLIDLHRLFNRLRIGNSEVCNIVSSADIN